MFSWLTDQVGAAAAGQSQTESAPATVELKQYYLNVENPMALQVMGIRSPGRDGEFSAVSYKIGPFDPSDFDEDIVWTDGFFVRWPQAEEHAD